jgi:SAM-dependent methyltransferase
MTNPRPEDRELGKYYQSEDYISHNKKSKSFIDLIYRISQHFTLGWKLSHVRTFSDKKAKENFSILDYGCGTGDFLKRAQSNSHTILGVEPSPVARPLAEENTGIKIHSSLTEITHQVDAITLWHVLEHIPDLNEILSNLREVLTENGTMFIAVPNHESYDAEKYKSNWAGYDVPRHLWHFSKNDMKLLLTKNNLNLISVIPMKLDSFYVSILSEKYKNGKLSAIGFSRALITGIVSNIRGGKKINHSSLIYIVRKQ